MAETLDPSTPARRRRSDARRNIDAILDAARAVLGERPDASMVEIATAAGVTRQTVYAHFPSRDALVATLVGNAAAETIAAFDATHLDAVPPADALRQVLDICWELVRRYPLLLEPALTRNHRAEGDAVHRAATARLERVVLRGQRTGDFDRGLTASWLADAVLGLTHTAAEQVATGRLTTSRASALLLESALRVCGAGPAE
ncbi:TetR/AcrR family transcriptional regulator [Actinomadura syzygii]|uniref:TetR/AcrR family transcriptional regulator n=1 Tax=Actinomadura syzygii TaxID=1427538 RepID=A0A5D0U771_9ACTN|nr:TetR/AcrR family transcriptional regulator [Actinomadura syzygii]TYC14441.1 TetR/AcrR family transcriptional regulator [Actinomadura syzygii]